MNANELQTAVGVGQPAAGEDRRDPKADRTQGPGPQRVEPNALRITHDRAAHLHQAEDRRADQCQLDVDFQECLDREL